jgi:hypothetical protein
MFTDIRERIVKFISDSNDYPFIAAIASGLYPFLFYYNSNFTLVNSWSQLIFFVVSFILIPTIIIYSAYNVFNRVSGLKRFTKYVVPILNISCFSTLLIIVVFGFDVAIILSVLLLDFILGAFLYKHLNKLIVFQFLLASLVTFMLIPDIYKHITYSNEWMAQPDNIADAVFQKRPNIYFIQPDGYTNFSELKKGHYNFDNSEFEAYLMDNDFKLYNNFRSNYVSTLSSNSSLFSMKHHYYNNTKQKTKELYNARQIIMGDNPTVSILKNNNYRTFLILERSYLMVNRPKIHYDYCNIELNEVSFLARGFEVHKDILSDLSRQIDSNTSTNNFYFISKMEPSHISVNERDSKGIIEERNIYLNALKRSNEWLKKAIDLIQEKDKNCIIIVAADHGGYVGLSYSLENNIKQTERDLIYSIYSTALAIKWPDKAPEYDVALKTPVNLFRIIFSYLSEDLSYLDHLQDDRSYALIYRGAPFGVYQYIDDHGNILFEKH